MLKQIMNSSNQNNIVDLLCQALKAEYDKKYIAAFLYYKRALMCSNNFEQKEMLQTALLRMGDKISSSTTTTDDQIALTITQKHNKKQTRWVYGPRLETKAICDVVLPSLDGISNVLLFDFTQGFISTRISEAGVDLTSLVPYSDIQRYMLREYPAQKREQFREIYYSKQQTFVLKNEIPKGLNYDLSIVILPEDKKWDFASAEQKVQILSELITQSKKGYLFVFADNDKNQQILQNLVNKFEDLTIKDQLALQNSTIKSQYDLTTKFESLTTENLQTLKNLAVKPNELTIKKQKILEKNWLVLSKGISKDLLTPPIAGVSNIASGKTRFKVSLDKCRDLTGKPYDKHHHFVKTLLEYPNHNKYKGSALEQYYDNFCPKNRQQLYGFTKEMGAISQGWPLDPWRTVPKGSIRQKRYETRSGGNHHFGPNSVEFGNDEFERLINIYKKISKNGYQPELYNDGFILGFFLIKGDDYRFVVTEGQHRIPTLAKLGYEYVDVKINKRYLSPKTYVRYEDVADFPYVKQGIYTEKEALACFDRYFS